jgi:threonine aldolase
MPEKGKAAADGPRKAWPGARGTNRARRRPRWEANVSEWIDIRSDTVTRPTAAMRRAMAEAEVGDDVFGDDPTLRRLEDRIAALTGKEAALYVVSGTMGNQLAIRSQVRHGDEVLLDKRCHIYDYEAGAAAAISGVQMYTIESDRGRMDPEAIAVRASRGENDHYPPPTLLCLENTHHRSGGAVVPLESLQAAASAARAKGLRVHLDGARLWNASVASGVPIARYAAVADTVQMCFSKGLGAPVGSILAGPADLIRRARRYRKMLGGGIRQGGILAAACLHALDHHVERLAEDHAHAKRLAEALADLPGIEVTPAKVETNMVLVGIVDPEDDADRAVARARAEGVLVGRMDKRIVRLAMHLDVDEAKFARLLDVLPRVLSLAALKAGASNART